MLQNMREKAHSWFAVLIITLVCLSFALWGIHNYVTDDSHSEAAVVNGKSIAFSEVEQQYQRLKQQQLKNSSEEVSISKSVDDDLKQAALNTTITQHVLGDAAHKEGYFIGNEQLREMLSTIPAFQIEGTFNEQRFNQVLQDINYSPETFIEDMQKALMLEQIRKGFINSSFVIPTDTQQAIRLIEQQRDISYALLSPQKFKTQIKISSKDIQNYYHQHTQQFALPEKVKLAFLSLRVENVKKKLRILPSEIKEYYEQNMSTFSSPQRWHLLHIQISLPKKASPAEKAASMQKVQLVVKDLKNGADFSKTAAKYSDDIISAQMGGELGWFTEKNVEPSIAQAIKKFKTVGDISEPLQNTYGFSIYKLIDIEKEKIEPLNKVSEQIEQTLLNEKTEQQFYDDREILTNVAFSHPHSLEPAASGLGLKIQTTDWLARQKKENTLFSHAAVMSAAFNPDVLINKNNSSLIEISPEEVIILRVIDYQKPVIQPYENVASQIEKFLLEQRAKKDAFDLGQKIVSELQNGSSVNDISKKYNLGFISKDHLKRADTTFDPMVMQEIFKMKFPYQKPFAYKGFSLASSDYMIVQLRKILDGNLELQPLQRQNFIKQQLEDGLGQLDYAFYVKSAIQSANIQVKNDNSIHSSS